MANLDTLIRRAETAEQWARICKIEVDAVALASQCGANPRDITQINVTDTGELANVELDVDDDGMGRVVLNFPIL